VYGAPPIATGQLSVPSKNPVEVAVDGVPVADGAGAGSATGAVPPEEEDADGEEADDADGEDADADGEEVGAVDVGCAVLPLCAATGDPC
jgi:hypothetical protein